MKLLHLEEEFNISVETFFTFFFESPGFKQRYHSTRGDNTIDVKPWSPLPDGRYTREITFSSFISNNPLINKLVGDKAKVREVQYYKFKDDSVLQVTSETFFEGSSYGKSFTSESEWIVMPSTNVSPGCKVVIKVKNNYGGTMFKSALENWVHDTTEASFKHWLSLVRSQVEEYEQSEKLKRSAPPTPIKPQGVVKKNTSSSNITTTTTTTSTSTINNKSNSNNNNRQLQNHNIDSDIEIDHLDENHTRVRENDRNNNILQALQQQQQHHHHHHNHQDDDEDDMSDLSGGPPSIHDDFLSDDEENRSSSDDQLEFFDSSEVWQNGNNDIRNYMLNLTNELSSMKSTIEVNHTRLLALENSFSQLQMSRILPQQLLPPTRQPHQSFTHQFPHSNEIFTTTTTTVGAPNDVNGMNLSSYIAKLEEMVKSQQDEEMKSREKQKEWEQKVSELESKLKNVKNSSKTTLWFNVMALLFFIIGWPIIARKLWKFIPPLINLIKK